MKAIIQTDASCVVTQKNGRAPMRIGYIITPEGGQPIIRVGRAVWGLDGKELGTVNRAEYLSIIHALRHAARYGFTQAEVYTDSQVVAYQAQGKYAVKDKDLQRLARELHQLTLLIHMNIHWVPRGRNKDADALSHQTLNHEPGLPPTGGPNALLPWQAARVRNWGLTYPNVNVGTVARIFTHDGVIGASGLDVIVGRILAGESYRSANLDGLPDWRGYSLTQASLNTPT